MNALRTIHALAALLCGAAIIAMVAGHLRIAVASVTLVLFLLIWTLEILRFEIASARREIRK